MKEMKFLKGISVSSGIAGGVAYLYEESKIEVITTNILKEQAPVEYKRFLSTMEEIVLDIDDLIDNYTFTKDDQDILISQKMIVQDPELNEIIRLLISEQLLSLESAIHKHFSEVIQLFRNLKNPVFAQRAADYQDIADRFLRKATGIAENSEIPENSIIIAEDIPPSKLSIFFKQGVRGICIEKGSYTSHASIIARALDLPAIVNIHEIRDSIENGDELIIDGLKGELVVNPTEYYKSLYNRTLNEIEEERKNLQKFSHILPISKDGKTISLMLNLEIPEEAEHLKDLLIDGIGLFRTEFIYLNRATLPSEDEQFEIYKSIAEKFKPLPVIFRTIDLGGDKLSHILNIAKEDNPYLGCRGIRLSLQHPTIFKAQLKALLRAACYGNIKIMLPMISSVDEILLTKQFIAECCSEFKENSIYYCSSVELGIMIEIPSAVIISESLAKHCDFFSIGTNDLTQYTLAVDRNSETVRNYYEQMHPAVLKLIKMTAEAGQKFNIPVAICGEIASDEDFTDILLGLGIKELSTNPSALLKIKKKILETNISEAILKADKLLSLETGAQIRKCHKELNNS